MVLAHYFKPSPRCMDGMDSYTAQGPGSSPIYRVSAEVLHRILSYLIKPWGSPENLNILLLSKHLYNVALPLTVKRFENPLGLEYEGSRPEAEVARYQRRNARFLRYLLIKRPELACYVQHIDLRALRIERRTPVSFAEHSEADLDIYADWLVNKLQLIIPYDSASEWIDSLGRGCSNAHFAFLVTCLPGLCTIAYDPANNDRDAAAQGARELAESPRTRSILRSLRVFQITLLPLKSISFPTHGISPRAIWHYRPDSIYPAMFMRPLLRSILRTHLRGATMMARKFEQVPPRTSPIEKISLSESNVSHSMLVALLNSCRAVKEFTLESGMRISGVHFAPDVRPRELIQALLPHAGTLKYLCTTFTCLRDLHKNEIVAGKSFFGRQLADMAVLTTIVADVEAVTGVSLRNLQNRSQVGQPPNELLQLDDIPRVAECLPACLEYLELRNCNFMVAELMQDFLLQDIGPGSRCENLRHLRLLFDFYDLGDRDHLQLWLDPAMPLTLDLEFMPE